MFADVAKVRDWLLRNKHPSYLTTNQQELRVRCPYCGDSRKNQSAAHLYIQMQPPFKFYCQKCNSKGIFNEKTMREFQLYDADVAIAITEMNRELFRSNQNSVKAPIKKVELINEYSESYISNNNLIYFNNRFESQYDPEFINKTFKVVLDPIKFIQDNQIMIQPGMYDFSRAIGFISADNSHVIFRDNSNSQSRRYFNLLLDQSNLEASKIYNIKTSINLMAPKVKLIITEGIFDIIGLYNLGKYNDSVPVIMAAASGKGFNAVISKYLHLGFLNMDIEIYSDNDVQPLFYRQLEQQSLYINNNLRIFYNNIGKDYGVAKNKIKLREARF